MTKFLKSRVDDTYKKNMLTMEKENQTIKSSILRLNDELKFDDPTRREFEKDKAMLKTDCNFSRGFLVFGKKSKDLKVMKENNQASHLTDCASAIGENQAFKYKDLLFDRYNLTQDNKNPNLISFKRLKKIEGLKEEKFKTIENLINMTKTEKRIIIQNVNKIIKKQRGGEIDTRIVL